METIFLHDKKTLECFFKKASGLHIYSIGDLDDFFWPYTSWYALAENGHPIEVAMLYIGRQLPALIAISEDVQTMSSLISSIAHLLPDRFYSHISPGAEAVLASRFKMEPHGAHYKMLLTDHDRVREADASGTTQLGFDDLPAIQTLYRESYPGNWFDMKMLETNQYFGIKKDGIIASCAGIHVYSKNYRVAALGNITTHPGYRNNGFARMVTARVCQSLLRDVALIGLNVKADNATAIRCYEKLGFSVIAEYGEFMVKRK